MCGITGIIATNDRLPDNAVSTVESMNAALFHRGPDDDGYYHDSCCSLAMRRLSIIDIEGGKQPIFNEARDVLVFQNGEIYNFIELKQDLQQKGHRFQTKSDTEVLVHLYEEYGTSMLEYIYGMFAFVLYDIRKGSFLIGRDRFGEKPLYYNENGGILSFSSEIKSLIENRSIERKVNTTALRYYFRTSLIPEPITLFESVQVLPAGHYMLIEDGKVNLCKYFSIEYNPDQNITNDAEAMEHIRPYLLNAVKRQSLSDVPIGSFLSGGIDSSTMVALLQQQSSESINTFTVRFEDAAYDESAIARKVAEFYNTNHTEITIPNREFNQDIFWQILDSVGQPFRDSSAIPTFHISQEIQKNVKVAISGDGGDELFGGYDIFQWYSKIDRLKSFPRFMRQMLSGSFDFIGDLGVARNLSIIRQLNRGLKTSLLNEEDIPIALNEMFDDVEINEIYSSCGESNLNNYALLKIRPKNWKSYTPLNKIMDYRLRHTLTSNMLVKVDRMSMANSLEVRAPFLDPQLFEAASKLPDKFLVRGNTGKYIIRKIMQEELPKEVFEHPKQGFNIPLHKYQNSAYTDLAKDLLIDDNPWPDLLDKKMLNSLISENLMAEKNTSKKSVFRSSHQLWMIMQLLGWARRYNVSA